MQELKVGRREAIAAIAVAGAGLAVGCGSDDAGAATPTSPTPTTPVAGSTCSVAPTETIGPYPSLTDLIRSDIREGRAGTTLALTITVVNVNNGCTPVSGAAVEIWQCDLSGNYSQYGTQRTETYLRGIQTTDSAGQVTFTTIYPGWYQGRATHIHVEVVRNGASVKATQIGFPDAVNTSVYATGAYASRGDNPTRNTSDNIFADSINQQLATVSGDPASGMTASFTLGIAG